MQSNSVSYISIIKNNYVVRIISMTGNINDVLKDLKTEYPLILGYRIKVSQ